MKQKKRHLFHLVDYSPWPLFVSLGAFFYNVYSINNRKIRITKKKLKV